MKDVTVLLRNYRECVRSLWNTYYRPRIGESLDWDLRDEFEGIACAIFSSLVSREIGTDDEIAHAAISSPEPRTNLHIVPIVEHGIPILISRDIPARGYWDHPVAHIRSTDAELRLVRFFDFDVLGYRDYRYYEVYICGSTTHPEIIGRFALVEIEHVSVFSN
jgi:hypothetical protein